MPEKTESLEEAAREPELTVRELAVVLVDQACGYTMEFASSPRNHQNNYDWAEEMLNKFAAERERQVWAEAANIAEEPYSDEIQAFGPDEPSEVGVKIAKALRARGEQVK